MKPNPIETATTALIDFIKSISPSAAIFTLALGAIGVCALALYVVIITLR